MSKCVGFTANLKRGVRFLIYVNCRRVNEMINVSPFEVFLRYVIFFFLCWSGKTRENILENKMYMSINSRKIKQIQKKKKERKWLHLFVFWTFGKLNKIFLILLFWQVFLSRDKYNEQRRNIIVYGKFSWFTCFLFVAAIKFTIWGPGLSLVL